MVVLRDRFILLVQHSGNPSIMIERKHYWQQVYSEKQPYEVSWFQPAPQISIDLIERSGIGKKDNVIDVGGGASRLVNVLVEKGYKSISVLDIADNALQVAKASLGKLASDIDWISSDITAFKPKKQYALWHDRAVFHFLTDKQDRQAYVGALKECLKPGGSLIIAAFAIGGPMRCSGLEIVQYDANKLLAELGSEFDLKEQVNECHKTPAGGEQEFSYFRMRRK